MLRFLNTRVIVNNTAIYPLLNTEPIVIPVEKDHPKIVVTDGFHFTKPLELVTTTLQVVSALRSPTFS